MSRTLESYLDLREQLDLARDLDERRRIRQLMAALWRDLPPDEQGCVDTVPGEEIPDDYEEWC